MSVFYLNKTRVRPIRAILIILAATAFSFSIVSSTVYKARDDAERTADFQNLEDARMRGEITFSGPYCHPDRHPSVLFSITLVIGCTIGLLIFVKNPLWSLPFSVSALLMFALWYSETQEALAMAETISIGGIDLYLYKANGFDIGVLVLISAIVASQLVPLFRSLRSRVRSNKLP